MHQRRTAQALASQRNNANHNRSASVGDAMMVSAFGGDTPSRLDDEELLMTAESSSTSEKSSSGGTTHRHQSSKQAGFRNGTSNNKTPHPIRTESPTEEDMFVDFDSPDNAAFVTATTSRLISMDSSSPSSTTTTPPRTPTTPTDAASVEEDVSSDFTPSADDIMATMDDFFPETASPKLERKTAYDEGFPDDLQSATSRPKLSSVFRGHSGKVLETTEEGSVGSAQSEGLAGGGGSSSSKLSPPSTKAQKARQQQQSPPQQDQQQQPPTGTNTLSMSSIDAFEASFATTFPRSFSSSPDTTGKLAELEEEDMDSSDRSPPEKNTYDPFHHTGKKSDRSRGDPPGPKSGSSRSSRASSSLQSVDTEETLPPTPRKPSDENGKTTKPNLARSSSSSSTGRRSSSRSGSPGITGGGGSSSELDASASSSVRSLRSRLEGSSNSINSNASQDAPSQEQRPTSASPTYLDTPDFNNDKAASARARYEKALQATTSPRHVKSPRTVGRLNPNKFMENQEEEHGEDLLAAVAISKSEDDDDDEVDDGSSAKKSDSPEQQQQQQRSPSKSNKSPEQRSPNKNSKSPEQRSPSNTSPSVTQEKSVKPSEIRAAAERERKTSSSTTSPTPTSLILKRLQQRRAKEQARKEAAAASNGGKPSSLGTISGISRAESRRRLNARVAAHLASPEHAAAAAHHGGLVTSPSDEQDLSPLGAIHKTAGNGKSNSTSDPPMFRRSYSGGASSSRRHGVDELIGHEDSYTDSGDYQRKKSISPEKTSKRYNDGGDSPEAVARTARARERARRSAAANSAGSTTSSRGDSYFPKTRPSKEPALVSPELGGSSGEDVLRDLAKTSAVI